MSGILGRTVFATKKSNGAIVFHDWARVTTGLGTMVEPFLANARPSAELFDNDDMISRIDEIHFIDANEHKSVLFDFEGTMLHGGQQSLVS